VRREKAQSAAHTTARNGSMARTCTTQTSATQKRARGRAVNVNPKSNPSLCYRCEYRAQYLEEGHAPRCECGDIKGSKFSCYMYKPSLPVWTVPSNTDDERPRFGPALFAARESAERTANRLECPWRAIVRGDSVLVYCAPPRKLIDHWRVFRNRVWYPVASFPRRKFWRCYYSVLNRIERRFPRLMDSDDYDLDPAV